MQHVKLHTMETITYTNPVWDGYFADPFVLKHKGEYWAYGTSPNAPDSKRFQVLHSKNLINWQYVGGALEPLEGDFHYYWAPEVAYRNGTFWMYYSASDWEVPNHRLRLATSRNPQGPFRDSGEILLPQEDFTIDAHPFRDPRDGKWYLFFAKNYFEGRVGTGLAVVELGDDMKPCGEVRACLRASADWKIFGRDLTVYGQTWDAWHTVEGPSVIFHEGLYYCLYSGGNWEGEGYGVGFGVAEHPLGPWRDDWNFEGAVVLRGVPGQVLGPGHNSVVIGPDNKTPYIVYHAWDAAHTARRMCIDPLIWTAEGPRCQGPTWTPQTLTQVKAKTLNLRKNKRL
ncbi:MAG TPA: glycoside hydrolase family 43 protein, partial [Abditibacteriaceae bacterium]